MTSVTGARYYEVSSYASRYPGRKAGPQNIFGAAALACIALACGWTVYSHLGGDNADLVTASLPPAASMPSALRSVPADRIAAAYSALRDMADIRAAEQVAAEARAERKAARERTALLYGPRLLGPQPGTFQSEQSAPEQVASLPAQDAPPQPVLPLPPMRQVADLVPVPAPRPAELRMLQNAAPSRREAARANEVAALVPPKPAEKPSIFERLFGRVAPFGQQLAFASPDGGVDGDGQSLTLGHAPMYDRNTAVYDISAHTVYMPDGTKLEAHSGLGSMLDDPRSADRKMRGVTPPHTYDLSLRESLFHGVEAIRLKPVGGEDEIYGRTGLLAHTYMLGPNGDSNGCVSFRNYQAFLRAYKSGQVKRLVVVAKL
ncbi:MAG TPA: DUF2778 domain-containing protein [Nitrobacter sp.]|nr:DUF2778 domain-containing protein [Nitrobacter sp.]